MKKTILLAAILSLFAASTAFAAFSDVPSSHPNYDAIDYVQTQGVVDGYPDGTFKPDQEINRAEFTKIIMNSRYSNNEIDTCTWATINFPEVPKDSWYAPFVCLAVDYIIIDGYPDGTFKPENKINFAEAAKIIVNANSFDVNPEADPWYEPYVTVLEYRNASPSSIQHLAANITRGEMAEMMYRLEMEITNKPSTFFALSGVEERINDVVDTTDVIPTASEWELYEDELGFYFEYPSGYDVLYSPEDLKYYISSDEKLGGTYFSLRVAPGYVYTDAETAKDIVFGVLASRENADAAWNAEDSSRFLNLRSAENYFIGGSHTEGGRALSEKVVITYDSLSDHFFFLSIYGDTDTIYDDEYYGAFEHIFATFDYYEEFPTYEL
jgi:S-layer homology domain